MGVGNMFVGFEESNFVGEKIVYLKRFNEDGMRIDKIFRGY